MRKIDAVYMGIGFYIRLVDWHRQCHKDKKLSGRSQMFSLFHSNQSVSFSWLVNDRNVIFWRLHLRLREMKADMWIFAAAYLVACIKTYKLDIPRGQSSGNVYKKDVRNPVQLHDAPCPEI